MIAWFHKLFNDKDSFQCYFILAILLCLFVPCHALDSIAIISFVVYSLMYYFYQKHTVSSSSLVWIFILYYLFMLVSAFWASDQSLALKALRIKSTLVGIPFCFLIFSKFKFRYLYIFSQIFITLILLYICWIGFNYFVNQEAILQGILKGQPIPIPFRSHIRFSILVNFALILSIYHADLFRVNRQTMKSYFWLVPSIILFFFIQFLAVKIGVLISILILFIFIFYKILVKKIYFKSILALGILFFTMVFLMQIVPTLQNKWAYFKWDIGRYLSHEYTKAYSDSERLISIYEGVKIIKSNPLLGVGEGNVANFMPKSDHGDVKLPHNQFIITWAQNGVLGCILFACIFIFGFLTALRQKNWTLAAYTSAMLLATMVEPMLETQIGVAVFTLPFLILYSIKES